MTFILGASHLHTIFTSQIQDELDNKLLFRDCILEGHIGLPNWSSMIPQRLLENADKNLIWIVSDYKFNNFEYDKICALPPSELFLDTAGFAGNIDVNFMTPAHNEVLGNHTLRIIDEIIRRFPNIKLIFWCLYTRTKRGSSYPSHLWYDVIKEKYKENTIDIDAFTDVDGMSSCVRDGGGHPNKDGYILLDKMVRSAFP
jgi:hypothetical protein